MPKQVLQLDNFSGGLDAYSDPRDIKDNQFSQNWNAIVSKSGIIRVAGMAERYIETDSFTQRNTDTFSEGYGLFQFSSDYSISKISSNFNSGLTSGTIDTYTSAGTFVLEDKPSTSSTNDAYNGLHIFIYSGTGIGESRPITDYVGSSRTITCETFTTTLHDKDDATPSKYIIYNWKSSNGWTSNGTGVRAWDAFTNGFNDAMHQAISNDQANNYYTVCNKSSISDEQSKNFGNIEYGSSLSLVPGVEYTLSFDCAAKHPWYNLVSKGYVGGIGDSGINSDNTSTTTVSATNTSVSLPVDGTLGASLAAMKAKILDRKVYKNDGTFIGICTSVTWASSSDGAVIFGDGIEADIANNTDLYVAGHGDKVPWIQLYSTTVADTQGSIKSISSNAVSTSSAWESDATYTNIEQYYSSGDGKGAQFKIITTGSGGTATFHFTNERGSGYAAGEVLRFKDPEGSGNYAQITVGAINVTGLSLTASQDTNTGAWKSGIAGNGQTSEYLKQTESNYISNGDFTDGTTGWTVATDTTAEEAGAGGHRYDEHDGTLLLNRTGGTFFAPADGGWDGYIYQDLTLPENTLYHLNFLYDAYQGQSGIVYTVYDTTNSVYLITPKYVGETRYATIDDGTGNQVGVPVNFRYGGQEVSGSYTNDLNKMNYIPFKVGNAPTNAASGEATCTVRIAFAKVVPSGDNIRLGMVNVYKAHNDLVTMNYKSPVGISGNPFSDNIESFSNYSIKFKIPENYSSVSDWTLKLYGGQYSFRTSNSITSLGSVSAEDSQEVYVDNIRLSDNSSDVITLLTDNGSNYTTISAYSDSSSTWIKDLIKWPGLKSKPTFDYVNGMLKISDGNFDNNNSNKLMYYAKKEDSYGSGKLGWVIKDEVIPNSPSLSVASTNTGNLLNQYVNCGNLLNQRYIEQTEYPLPGDNSFTITTKLCGDYDHGASSNQSSPPAGTNTRNAGQVASAFGPNDIQGFVLRYWFDRKGKWETPFSDDYGGRQIMIPRFDSGESNQVSLWYNNAVLGQGEPYLAGGYDDDLQENLPTGNIHNDGDVGSGWGNMNPGVTVHSSDYVNLHGVGIKYTNQNRASAASKTFPTYKDIGIPLEIIQTIDNVSDNAGDIAKIDIEFEYEMFGQGGDGVNDDELASMSGPYFKLDLGKPADISNSDGELDNINVNYVTATIDNMITRNYGNGCTPPVTENLIEISKENYNLPEDDGVCISKSYEQYNDRNRLNLTFSDSISFTPGQLTKNDRILLKLTEHSEKNHGGKEFHRHWAMEAWYNEGYDSSDTLERNNQFSTFTTNIKASFFTRFKINKLRLYYFNTAAEISGEETLENLNNSDAKVLFEWGSASDEGSLSWGERTFKIASTSVNIFDEESSLLESSEAIGGIGEPTEEFPNGMPNISLGHAPTIRVRLSHSHFNDSYIKKTKFYMKDENSEIWYLQFYIDHKEGTLHSTTSGIKSDKSNNISNSAFDWMLDRENFLNFNEVNSYESETMVSQEDAFDISNLTCRYKTSVIANNRMYVGNIMQKGRIYGDRMLKSPIGKYNILPKSNFIDVAINDGDEITALAYYKDKLLQFKKRKVFVINISGDYEFLEDTFDNAGVRAQACVTKTNHGIVWANKSGCYLYDGSQLTNLIDNKVPLQIDNNDANAVYNYWLPSNSGGLSQDVSTTFPVISYIQERDVLLLKWSAQDVVSGISDPPDMMTYHFPTQSWCWHIQSTADSNAQRTGAISNMISDVNGDVIYYRTSVMAASDTKQFDGIKKWNDGPTKTDIGGTTTKYFVFTTKDFTFGDVANKKKIYKVYITYKTTDGTDTSCSVYAAKNGTNSYDGTFGTSYFVDTSTVSYNGSALQDTGGKWKMVELKFTTPSDWNNVNSFSLRFIDAFADIGFEINDITIVYRVKRVK